MAFTSFPLNEAKEACVFSFHDFHIAHVLGSQLSLKYMNEWWASLPQTDIALPKLAANAASRYLQVGCLLIFGVRISLKLLLSSRE